MFLEEKMWARMQRERNQSSRGRRNCNLGDGDDSFETLTHKGQVLRDDYNDHDRSEDVDDLDADVVGQLHFGGGVGQSRQIYQVWRNRRGLIAGMQRRVILLPECG